MKFLTNYFDVLNIYSGILFNFQEFDSRSKFNIQYCFSCDEFRYIQEKYNLYNILDNSSQFNTTLKLIENFFINMKHDTFFENHIEVNTISLLEYCFNNPENGINCYNKSKILQELCMSLHIYARRLFIMPLSPYDTENHVIV